VPSNAQRDASAHRADERELNENCRQLISGRGFRLPIYSASYSSFRAIREGSTIAMWTIQLFGQLALNSQERTITRFRTQKAASLLAYLAFHTRHNAPPNPRELLIEMLWPQAAPEPGRANLSNALSILRHLLEPPGVPPNAVLLADRFSVRLHPPAVTTDVVGFEEAACQLEQDTLSEQERLSLLQQAAHWYAGPLLPGYYDDWIAPQALRLGSLFLQVSAQLVPLLVQTGSLDQALVLAQRATATDPFHEEAHLQLMQVLAALGQASVALREYGQFAKRVQEELEESPSEALRAYARQLQKSKPSATSLVSPMPVAVAGRAPLAADPPARTATNLPLEPSPSGSSRLRGEAFVLLTTTRFFGREAEIKRLHTLLCTPRTRLVTITGAGGTGKTRLALEAAAQLMEAWWERRQPNLSVPQQALFAPLAEVTEAARLLEVLLRALGRTPSTDIGLLEQVKAALAGEPSVLLVLDNFEQLVEEGASQVQGLLAHIPELKCLVTSRQTLQVEGEQEFPLTPLPTAHGVEAGEALLTIPSVALFVDRAQSVRPDFQLTSQNASTVAALCEHLEGIPLALELAAARLQLLSVGRILEQISVNRLDFLSARKRDAVSRHRTLRATLDWSYALLPPSGQAFLMQLGVFRGGWTLEAAETVCQIKQGDTLELLSLLRDNSLLGVADTEEGVRFTLLETVREYACEQLGRTGQLESVHRRHRDYFLALAEEAAENLTGPEQAMWLERLERENANLRAALAWSLEQGERQAPEKQETGDGQTENPSAAECALRQCAALWRFWESRGYWYEGREQLERALHQEGAQAPTRTRADALNRAGVLAQRQGDYEAAKLLYEESLAIRQEIGDRKVIAGSLNNLGNVAKYQGDNIAARAYYEEALVINRAVGNRAWEAINLDNLGNLNCRQGDYGAAKELYEESLTIKKALGDRGGIATSLDYLGSIAYEQGDYRTAKRLHEESLAIRRELGDRQGIATSLSSLGSIAYEQGDYGAAKDLYAESLAIRRELGDKGGIAASHDNLGLVAFEQGDYGTAKKLHEEGLAIRRESKDRWGIAYSLHYLGSVAFQQGDYGAARGLFEESMTIRRELGEKWCIASLLEEFVKLAAQRQPERAARLWGAAEALREAIGTPLPPKERKEYGRQIAALREALGEKGFVAAWAEGQAMMLEEAIAYALETKPPL
jgi:predicted ATPase/DNA-binding SARP family transcriptional activator/uncharacterized protein HemY